MKQSDFVAKVADFEGFSAVPYKCPSGKWTIGFGRTKGVTQLTPSTTREIEYVWLENELEGLQHYITQHYFDKFNSNETQALASFAFNCGIGNLDKLLDEGKRSNEQIASRIILYNKSNGRVLEGLTKRRLWEQSLFMANDTYRISSKIGFKVDTEWLFYTGKSILQFDFGERGKHDCTVLIDSEGEERYVMEEDIIYGVYPMQFFGA